jgi:hypothetical protein
LQNSRVEKIILLLEEKISVQQEQLVELEAKNASFRTDQNYQILPSESVLSISTSMLSAASRLSNETLQIHTPSLKSEIQPYNRLEAPSAPVATSSIMAALPSPVALQSGFEFGLIRDVSATPSQLVASLEHKSVSARSSLIVVPEQVFSARPPAINEKPLGYPKNLKLGSHLLIIDIMKLSLTLTKNRVYSQFLNGDYAIGNMF